MFSSCPGACSAVGSAPEWHSGGHRFDPGQVHQPSLTACRHQAERIPRLPKNPAPIVTGRFLVTASLLRGIAANQVRMFVPLATAVVISLAASPLAAIAAFPLAPAAGTGSLAASTDECQPPIRVLARHQPRVVVRCVDVCHASFVVDRDIDDIGLVRMNDRASTFVERRAA